MVLDVEGKPDGHGSYNKDPSRAHNTGPYILSIVLTVAARMVDFHFALPCTSAVRIEKSRPARLKHGEHAVLSIACPKKRQVLL